MIWLCDNPECPHVYRDNKGVGVHRPPLRCPECGYPVLGYETDPRKPAPAEKE